MIPVHAALSRARRACLALAGTMILAMPTRATSLDGLIITPLDDLFTDRVGGTWVIGIPLGVIGTFFVLLTRRGIAARTMWALLWSQLAIPFFGGFLLWLFPRVTDPAAFFVVVIGVAGGIGLDHAAASLVKRDDEN